VVVFGLSMATDCNGNHGTVTSTPECSNENVKEPRYGIESMVLHKCRSLKSTSLSKVQETKRSVGKENDASRS
jgi:hypothetical protein